MSRSGFIEKGDTREGLQSAEFLRSHIIEIAESLSLTEKQEKEILGELGMSALISKGQERKRNLLMSLENSLSASYLDSTIDQWQQAVDWNTSLALNKSVYNDAEATLVQQFGETLKLWRGSSPFTIIDGRPPQFELQTRSSDVVRALRQLTQRFLSQKSITEITVHKALRWESAEMKNIPLSESRPSWYSQPSADNTSDGYDEQISSDSIGASNVLLSRYSGFTVDLELAVDIARHCGGRSSNYYAVLTGTVPAESVVCIPTLGFGSLSKMEVVIDSSTIQSGSFSAMFGRAA